ncbi:MAG: ORF6N domain-containing protein [Melioribacter sp.]|nr:ORF6N domain-containing protein [Melioribacter sp.]
MKQTYVVPTELIVHKIFFIRGQKIILDRDLAVLYKIETRTLKQAVKRNKERFPKDFMFILTPEEIYQMVSQNVIPSKSFFGGANPMAFTEQGVAMLSSVLKSKRAIEVNILIMRAFVRLREVLASHKDLAQKLKELESKFEGHDEQIKDIIEAINQLLLPPEKPKPQIGFQVKEPKQKYSSKKQS